jgi:hypothetical protein
MPRITTHSSPVLGCHFGLSPAHSIVKSQPITTPSPTLARQGFAAVCFAAFQSAPLAFLAESLFQHLNVGIILGARTDLVSNALQELKHFGVFLFRQ